MVGGCIFFGTDIFKDDKDNLALEINVCSDSVFCQVDVTVPLFLGIMYGTNEILRCKVL